MTNMQVEYNKLLETRRHNEATERAVTAQLEQQAAQTKETIRHNLQTEALSASDLQEKIRHQLANDTENMRHNQASEAEINRHNLAMEKQAKADNDVKLAIAKMNNLTSERINSEKLSNDRWLKQQDLEYQRTRDELNRALERYSVDTKNALEVSKLEETKRNNDIVAKQNDERIKNDSQKIANDMTKISADIVNQVRKTAAEYAKLSPQQLAIASAMLPDDAQWNNALLDGASVPTVAAKLVEAIVSQNNLKDARDKDAAWWEKAIDTAVSLSKWNGTISGIFYRYQLIKDWVGDSSSDTKRSSGSNR